MDTWIYTQDFENQVRYTLGKPGKNNLICIGANPSTAEPGDLDPTLKVVDKLSKKHGFDGWLMLNVYPQRATNPNDIHKSIDEEYHKRNLQYIDELLQQYPECICWAAWGTLIEKRKYLKSCLQDIYEVTEKYHLEWVTIGRKSVKGHPHHPLFLKHDSPVDSFLVEDYINV